MNQEKSINERSPNPSFHGEIAVLKSADKGTLGLINIALQEWITCRTEKIDFPNSFQELEDAFELVRLQSTCWIKTFDRPTKDCLVLNKNKFAVRTLKFLDATILKRNYLKKL